MDNGNKNYTPTCALDSIGDIPMSRHQDMNKTGQGKLLFVHGWSAIFLSSN